MSSPAQKRAGFLFCDVPKEKKDERRSDSTYASARSAPTLAFRRDPLRFLRTMQQYGRLVTIHLGKVPASKEIDT